MKIDEENRNEPDLLESNSCIEDVVIHNSIIMPQSDSSAEHKNYNVDNDSNTATKEQLKEGDKEPFTIFSTRKLIAFLAVASLTATISPLSSSIYMPAVNSIQNDLGISTEQVNLTITAYMIFQATSPTFWGTLADSHGRRPILLSTMVVYCGACIGLALSRNYPALIVFRMIQACGSSPVIAISAGILSDIVESDKRASYYGYYSLGQLLGLVLGPVFGGIISQYLGWRWIFWILLIIGGTAFLSIFFIVPETLRILVGNGSGYGNPTPTQWLARRRGLLDEEKIAAIKEANSSRPKMNFFVPFIYISEPDVFLTLWLIGILNSVMYAFMTSTTKQFSIYYPFLNELEIGICFICISLGLIIGSIIQGKISDREYQTVKTKFEKDHPNSPPSDFPIHKARLGSLWRNLAFVGILTILYGWMFHINAPLAIPLIIQFFIGLGTAGFTNTASTLLVDLYPGKGASISASNNLIRCALGAAASVYINPGIEGVGISWMFTIVGAILLVHIMFLPLLIKFGPKWRRSRADKSNRNSQS